MQCNSLDEVRSHIDAIDDQTIALIGGRGQYAVQASAFKKWMAVICGWEHSLKDFG